MSKEDFKNVLSIAKNIIKDNVNENSTIIDATAGNGNDTLFFKNIIKDTGKIYCFDIQKKAIENTKTKLLDNGFGLENVILINDSHDTVDKYIDEEIDFVIYNLGYLPGGNHSIITTSETTIKSIEKCIRYLKKFGKIIIVGYIGHMGGKLEIESIHKYLSNLDQKLFNIFKIEFINQVNFPPLLYCLEKKI